MRFLPTIKDSRGRESHTLFFVAAANSVLLFKYGLAGLMLFGIGPFPPMSAGEFGSAFVLILAAWLGREWTDKVAGK